MVSSLDHLVIRRTTAAQQIADALTEMIAGGEVAPGAPLRESALAAQLAVSRNTVREAVRILEQSGLVRVEVGRGAVVRPVDELAIRDLYGARQVLEVRAVEQSRGVDLVPVRCALDDFAQALRSGASELAVEHDLAFHASIVATLGNARLDRFFADLCGELRFFLAVVSRADHEVERPDELLQQHAAILRLWEAGDRRQAAKRLREHISLNANRVLAVLGDGSPATR